MKLTLLSVGDKLPAWANTAVAEYLKRMPREARVELVEIKPEKRAGQSADSIKASEAARLLEKLPSSARLVALDEHGREASTRELADRMARWMADGRDVALIIGGADGLAAGLLEKAEDKLSLSRLTLPHALARVLLAEQLYRAVSLLNNHPYHRE
ncbi:MAG: 23S rRNA (pseudouridine(1915)-N(3))-methyltransferase RlmH [Hydrogenophilales bacterium CG17_big_fil_post_rev_8_21_14_2_50_63_12]|nr:MAG: 23S rRNA (pseudouridine(1915)-N(3))-methyltransferase RlmH [Hydrogenophilales bacterium CG17_big_fil_post_rev_8_21_14_2_50_63_12]PIX95726.1 MAG: 23S rRNA (pseudouridine(1915)-N(3))-methyltransferase RlmH [Hydrogenophilales bacterium CG_4_10_14_3_um_filter_63_21]PJB03947.1 MAG: 23S rRNA (pseudouridine(1915)-N(3))-methyltransferase RlmH [Hydrogenophilales bacterium CG_4_9_14_3_um_filter_63_34]